jgi:MFS family permease
MKRMLLRKIAKLKPRTVELAFVAGLLVLVEGILWYTLPPYFDKAVGLEAAGFILAAYGISSTFLGVPAGDLADKVGRKFTFSIGVLIMGLSLLLLFSKNFVALTAFMFLLGMASTFILEGSSNKVLDLNSKKNAGKAEGMYQAFRSMGWAIGSITGGILLYFLPYNIIFKLLLALLIAALLWTWRRYPEKRLFKFSDLKKGVLALYKDRVYLGEFKEVYGLGLFVVAFSVCSFAYGFYEYAMWMSEPIYVHQIGANLIIGGFIIAIIDIPSLFFAYGTGTIADKLNGYVMVFLGILIALSAHLWFVFLSSHGLGALALTFLLLSIAELCIFIPFEAWVRRKVRTNLRAETRSSVEAFYDFGGIIAPLFVGAVSSTLDFKSIFMVSFVLFVIAFTLLMAALHREPKAFDY